MPETRTFDPDSGNELNRLVREALGETIRPAQPGGAHESSDDDAEPSAQEPGVSQLPSWGDGDGMSISF